MARSVKRRWLKTTLSQAATAFARSHPFPQKFEPETSSSDQPKRNKRTRFREHFPAAPDEHLEIDTDKRTRFPLSNS